jgi:hypothetical protein
MVKQQKIQKVQQQYVLEGFLEEAGLEGRQLLELRQCFQIEGAASLEAQS